MGSSADFHTGGDVGTKEGREDNVNFYYSERDEFRLETVFTKCRWGPKSPWNRTTKLNRKGNRFV